MNIQTYLVNKGIEKLEIEAIKGIIRNDSSISKQERQTMIAIIDSCSAGKDLCELIQIISSPNY